MPLASAEDAQDCAARINETVVTMRAIEATVAKLSGATVEPITIRPGSGDSFRFDPKGDGDLILEKVREILGRELSEVIASMEADAAALHEYAHAQAQAQG